LRSECFIFLTPIFFMKVGVFNFMRLYHLFFRRLFIIIFFSVSICHSIFSQDSTKVFVEKEIVVMGERIQTKASLLPSSVSVLSPIELQRRNGTSVASVLKEIPAVFVRSYGGNGSLKLISMRGMGGEHTAVLVDGEQFSKPQDALVDLGIFLTDDVERIELAKGGYSSLVGSSAVGGVLNIVTKKPTKEPHASVSSALGSFGFQSSILSLSGGTESIRLKSSFSVERSRNNYGFILSDGGRNYNLERSGADYSIKTASIQSSADIQENMEATVSARYSLADRGQPAGVSSPFQNNLARLNDENLFLTSSLRWQYYPRTFFSIAPRFYYFLQHYRAPLSNTNSYTVSRLSGISFSALQNIGEQDKLRGELDGAFADVRGSELNTHTRLQGGISISSENYLSNSDDVVMFPSFRIDKYESLPLSFSPRFGVNVQVLNAPEIRLRGSVGKNFRAPTFNELYYRPGGNPNLNPEKSLSGDAGILVFTNELGKWRFENNYFVIDTKDRIVWTPGAGSDWSAKNLYRVISSGVEVMVEHSFMEDMFRWNASYSYMEVTRKDAEGAISQAHNKQLIYTPFELASASVHCSIKPITISLYHSYTGFRYFQENNDPRFILPSFQTSDAVLLVEILAGEFSAMLKAEVQNIFNSQYQWIPSYPVPGRSYALTISLHR